MIIQRAMAPGYGAGMPIKLSLGGGQTVRIAAGAPTAEAPPPKQESKTTELIAPLLKATTIPTVAKGGYWLVSNLNDVTPAQFAGQLQQFNIVNDPGMAQNQASEWLSYAQSKGANSILLGGVAGVTAIAIVETIRPGWPSKIKLAIGAVVTVAVASLLYFGFQDKPPPKQPPPEKTATV